VITVTEYRPPNELRAQAERSRRLASAIADPALTRVLNALADEYEAQARKLEETQSRQLGRRIA
jgi:hypothetical protein